MRYPACPLTSKQNICSPGGVLLSRKIVEAEIENFESRKFISGSDNSQKRYNYIENMNIVGQRCVAFFRALIYRKLLMEE